MSNEAPDYEALLWNEAQFISAHYKPYFKTKRAAFVANANEHSRQWKFYMAIDEAWVRGLQGCSVGGELDWAFR